MFYRSLVVFYGIGSTVARLPWHYVGLHLYAEKCWGLLDQINGLVRVQSVNIERGWLVRLLESTKNRSRHIPYQW